MYRENLKIHDNLYPVSHFAGFEDLENLLFESIFFLKGDT